MDSISSHGALEANLETFGVRALPNYHFDKADVIVRFQGGHNAGHTIYNDEKKFVLHLIPSGIFYDHVSCFIGQGVILSLDSLLEEAAVLGSSGDNEFCNLNSFFCSCLVVLFEA